MSSGAARPETIRESAKACLDLFSQSILVLLQSDGSNVQRVLLDEFGRFKLWTSNIGVFAELQSSLDFRLREFSDIKEPFLRQLTTIESRLQQFIEDVLQTRSEDFTGKELDEPGSPSGKSEISSIYQDWDRTQLLESIHQSIDWLHRLSNLVRKANFANQNKRADAFKLEDADKNDMTETLINYYTMLIKREFKALQDSLVQRLAASMVMRRRRIMYRRFQQRRWKLQQVEYTAGRLEQPDSLTKLEPAPSKYAKKTHLQSEKPATRAETKLGAQSRLTATTVDTNIRRKFSAASGISRGSTAPLDMKGKELVPLPPMAAKSGENFICDYCCLILPSKIALDSNTWADHVKKDLDPYVCVVDQCEEPTEIYSSRQEWLAHMRTRHLMRWSCTAKPHTEPIVLEQDFIEHMKTEHPGKFRDDQLSLIAESCSHPKDPTFDACPFCSETSQHLEEHVGYHLHDLALRSLPWPEDDVQGHQQGLSSEIENSSSGEGIRSTVRDFRSELSELNFEDDSQSDVQSWERFFSYGLVPHGVDQYWPSEALAPSTDEVPAAFPSLQYPGMGEPSSVNTTKRLDGNAEQFLDDSPHRFNLSDLNGPVQGINKTGDFTIRLPTGNASPTGAGQLEGVTGNLLPHTNPLKHEPSKEHSDGDDNGGRDLPVLEMPADTSMDVNLPSDSQQEFLGLDQSVSPLEPRSLIDTAWDALEIHVAESKNKMLHMTRNHLVNQLLETSVHSVAIAGLDMLTAILGGQPPTSPMKALCFVHVIYCFSLVSLATHEEDTPSRWTDLFIQAMSYNTYFSDQDCLLYTQAVNRIWRPAGITNEDVDSLIQAKTAASQSSSLKGKEPETHPIYQIKNDSLAFVAKYFLDDLEYLIIHTRDDQKIRRSALYTLHLGDIKSDATPRTAFGRSVHSILQNFRFQQFISYPKFSASLDNIREHLHSNVWTTIRRLELELMHVGKMYLPSDVYVDSYISFIRSLTDELYAQDELNFVPRTSYYIYGILFIRQIVTGSLVSQLKTNDITPEKPALLAFPAVEAMAPNDMDSLAMIESDITLEKPALLAFPEVVEATASSHINPLAATESDSCCEICGYRPKGDPRWFKGSMAKHKKLSHSTLPPRIFKCPFPGCNSQYKNRPDNLRQHQIEKNHFVDEQFPLSKRKRLI